MDLTVVAVGSLLTPFVLPKVLAPFASGKGKYGKGLLVTAGGAVVVTTVADLLARRDGTDGVRDLGTGPLEPAFNTPSHHRVHHGSQQLPAVR